MIAAELVKPLDFGRAFEENVGVISLRTAFLCLAAVLAGLAQQPGPALSVDANAGRHAISPDIYGINFYWDLGSGNTPQNAALAAAAALDIRATGRRWGGNSTRTYHWKFDVDNLDADWFYEVLPDTSGNAAKLPDGSSFNQFADQVRVSGGKSVGTIPVLGWLPKGRKEISEDQTRRKLVTACKKAGIPRLGWHAFRRYFATQTDRNGMRPLDRQNSLGHASQEMTAHYTTEDLERRRPAVNAIAKGLFKERR